MRHSATFCDIPSGWRGGGSTLSIPAGAPDGNFYFRHQSGSFWLTDRVHFFLRAVKSCHFLSPKRGILSGGDKWCHPRGSKGRPPSLPNSAHPLAALALFAEIRGVLFASLWNEDDNRRCSPSKPSAIVTVRSFPADIRLRRAQMLKARARPPGTVPHPFTRSSPRNKSVNQNR